MDELVSVVTQVIKEVSASPNFSGDARIDDSELIDLADVFIRSGDSVRRTKLILKAFSKSYAGPLEALSKAGASKDVSGLMEAAHALKGLLLDVGAKEIGGRAGTIEDLCKRDEGTAAFPLVGRLSRDVYQVAAVLEESIHRLDQGTVAAQPPKPTTVIERSELLQAGELERARLAADPVRFVTWADRAVKDAIGHLTDMDLEALIPASLAKPVRCIQV